MDIYINTATNQVQRRVVEPYESPNQVGWDHSDPWTLVDPYNKMTFETFLEVIVAQNPCVVTVDNNLKVNFNDGRTFRCIYDVASGIWSLEHSPLWMDQHEDIMVLVYAEYCHRPEAPTPVSSESTLLLNLDTGELTMRLGNPVVSSPFVAIGKFENGSALTEHIELESYGHFMAQARLRHTDGRAWDVHLGGSDMWVCGSFGIRSKSLDLLKYGILYLESEDGRYTRRALWLMKRTPPAT